MSLFQTRTLICPHCSKPIAFDAVDSVNADRRPDLRAAILDGTFQRMDCPHCGARFRLDCDFTLLDIRRGQWIVAAPVARIGAWQAVEAEARDMFGRAYGDEAPPVAQDIGRRLKTRLVFGWPALREKLLVADLGLDDLALEACKAMAIRAGAPMPARAVSELRLFGGDEQSLLLAWERSYDGAPGDAVKLPRKLHDGIAADAQGAWASFLAPFEGALFVDLKRQLVRGKAA